MPGHILVVYVSYKLVKILLLFYEWSREYLIFQRQYLQVIHSFSTKVSKVVDTYLVEWWLFLAEVLLWLLVESMWWQLSESW